MRGRPVGLLVLLIAFPSAAIARPVLVLGSHGHAVVRNDPFLTVVPGLPPAPAGMRSPPAAAQASRTVSSELARLYHHGRISRSSSRGYRGDWAAALSAERQLSGTRAVELEAVIANAHWIAASGQLTASRLPAVFLTVNRNRQWWTSGPLPSSGQLLEFSGSELVWEYYPGQGLELQELASFGRADHLYTAGRADYPRMRHLLKELIPLAAHRAGGLAWEYYFNFDGGTPPWTSAMSQGTALEALTRAHEAFGGRAYLNIAHKALPLFGVGPPRGVAVRTSIGTRYLLYSFAPGAAVLNGFLQSLIGLYDYAHASGDSRAARLFAAGDAEARREVPHYDTGTWSLYQPGVEDSLDYHVLVTGFLHQLCDRTSARVYCVTARRFDSYLRHRQS